MMSTSWEAVNRRCFGGHDHIQLLGRRAKAWGSDTASNCGRGMRAAGCGEAQGLLGNYRQLTIATMEAGPTLEESELLSLPDNATDVQEFRDRSIGLPLDPEMVRKARELEMRYMDELEGCLKAAIETSA